MNGDGQIVLSAKLRILLLRVGLMTRRKLRGVVSLCVGDRKQRMLIFAWCSGYGNGTRWLNLLV